MVQAAAAFAPRDASQRIVITGMGVASCFGNDVDTFYDRQASYPGSRFPLLLKHIKRKIFHCDSREHLRA